MLEVNEGRNGATSWVITSLQYFKLSNGYTKDTANFIFRNFFPVLVAVMFVTCNRHADSILHLSAKKS